METCAALGCPPVHGNTCHCASCHNAFTGVTSFDRHQRLAENGITCLDPAMVLDAAGRRQFGAWRVMPGGQPVWGRALRPGETRDGRYARGLGLQAPGGAFPG